MTFYDNDLTLYHLTDPNPNGDRSQVVFAVVPDERRGFDGRPVIGYGQFNPANGNDMCRGSLRKQLRDHESIEIKRVYSETVSYTHLTLPTNREV